MTEDDYLRLTRVSETTNPVKGSTDLTVMVNF